MDHLLSIENLLALLTLTALEIVLGIDNIVFLAILSGKLPADQRARARRIGLSLAMFMRIGLLMGIKWIMGLTTPWFSLLGHDFSGRDLILLLGGLFLIAKSTHEIHEKFEGPHEGGPTDVRKGAGFASIVAQIVVIDLVFSLDSVITAVGMAKHIEIMIAAVVVAVIIMMVFADGVSHFVERHPTIKMLALSFLLLIGVMLLAEGFDKHVDRGYVYFAMAFSLIVETLNIKTTRKHAGAPHA